VLARTFEGDGFGLGLHRGDPVVLVRGVVYHADMWSWPAAPTWITVMAFVTGLNYLSLKYWVF